MKYKIAIFIIATVSFMYFYNIDAFASINSLKQLGVGCVVVKNTNNLYDVYFSNTIQLDWEINNNNRLRNQSHAQFNCYYGIDFDPIANPDRDFSYFNSGYTGVDVNNCIIVLVYRYITDSGGNYTLYESEEQYLNDTYPPPEPDTWYEILWNQFTDWIDSVGDTLSIGYDRFIDWLKGESTHGGGHEFRIPDMVTPSPIPTPIPYNTVIVPKTDPDTGLTYYEYNYIYNNPSGTPIITGQPPNVNVTVNDNDFEYPYYDNPNTRNNPYYFDMPWYLKFVNNNNVFDVNDMGDNLTVIETAVNDETISSGVDTAYSSMSVLPTSWLQLIGIIAAIPLIGALIARFLKG